MLYHKYKDLSFLKNAKNLVKYLQEKHNQTTFICDEQYGCLQIFQNSNAFEKHSKSHFSCKFDEIGHEKI